MDKKILISLAAAIVLAAITLIAPGLKPALNQLEPPCVREGCSGELCVPENSEGFATICSYREDYKCLKDCRWRGDECSFDMEYYRACAGSLEKNAQAIGPS